MKFILRDLRTTDGQLLRTYNNGHAKIDGYLEDHAFLLEALLALFETTCEERWFIEARALADTLIGQFSDPVNGGFFSTAADGEALIARRKDLEDSPIPAGGSSAAMGLLRLAQLTGEDEYERQALGVLALLRDIAPRHPTSFGHLLQALHRASPPRARSPARFRRARAFSLFLPTRSTNIDPAPIGSHARGSRPTLAA